LEIPLFGLVLHQLQPIFKLLKILWVIQNVLFFQSMNVSGRSIHPFSGVPSESEVLIPAGSQFKIISIVEIGLVTMVQLKQIPSLEKHLKLE